MSIPAFEGPWVSTSWRRGWTADGWRLAAAADGRRDAARRPIDNRGAVTDNWTFPPTSGNWIVTYKAGAGDTCFPLLSRTRAILPECAEFNLQFRLEMGSSS
jgi:hypothetical protein